MENQKKFFDENGYLIVKKLFSQKECETWRQLINKNFGLNHTHISQKDINKKTFVCPDGVTKNSDFWPIIFNKKIIKVVKNLLNSEIKYTQHSDIHINLSAGKYHRDNAHRTFGIGPDWNEKKESYKVVRVAIYFSSFDESGSSLIILPKSNKIESIINNKEVEFWNKIRHFWRKYFNNNFLPHFLLTRKKINFKSNAGDCVIFDQRILHAGGILKGNQPKYSIFLSYGIKNSHSRNHKNFYLSRPTYTKKIPNKLRQKLKRENLLL